MPRVHFLNVNDGDCSVIQHGSGRVTVIDVSAAEKVGEPAQLGFTEAAVRQYSKSAGVLGNFNRSRYPDNPISYMKDHGITSVFRFVSTHPDMDHLDGIRALFDEFAPLNFWDTENTKEMGGLGEGRFDPGDWEFYKGLRDGKPRSSPRRMVLYSGDKGVYWNKTETGAGGGDGLYVLSPTPELVAAANEAGDWNDSSYVILYRAGNKRVLFSGDSHDATWEHILDRWANDVAGVDVMIAPHHGRGSDRGYDFLDVVEPRLTLFGNARCEHLAYPAWNSRDLLFVTNNQAGTVILDVVKKGIGAADSNLDVYVSHKPFAEAFVQERDYPTYYGRGARGWFLGRLQ